MKMPEEPKQDLNMPPAEPQTPPTWGASEPTSSAAPAEQTVAPEDMVPEFDIEPATGPASAAAVSEVPVTATEETPAPSAFNPFGESSTPVTPTTPVDLSASLASEIASTEAPVVATAATVASSGKKKSKKPIVIGGIIALVLGLLAGGGVFAYSMYQNPQKVISDAVMSAITAKVATYTGTMKIDSSDVKASIALTGKGNSNDNSLHAEITITTTGKDLTLTGDAVLAKNGDLYVKLSKLDTIASELTRLVDQTTGTSSASYIQKALAKVDGTWIKVSSEDLKTYSDSLATSQSCFTKVSEKYKNDSSVINEIGTLYQKNQFIVVEKDLGIVNGSIGYQLKADDAKTKAFAESLKSTKLYTALHDCDETFTIDPKALVDNGEVADTYQLWANQWTHQLTKFGVQSTSGGATLDATISTDFSKAVTVDIPSNTTTLAQLTTDLQAIVSEK